MDNRQAYLRIMSKYSNGKYNWSKAIEMFDKFSNSEISKELGIPIKLVSNRRILLGYNSVPKNKDAIDMLMSGKMTYKEISDKTGIKINALRQTVRRLGIRYSSNKPELEMQSKFVLTLNNPKQFVYCDYGIIDVLTDDAIYELKVELSISKLHSAIGQLFTYSLLYPNRRLVIVYSECNIELPNIDGIEYFQFAVT